MLTRPILFRVKRPVEDICSDIAHFLLIVFYSRNPRNYSKMTSDGCYSRMHLPILGWSTCIYFKYYCKYLLRPQHKLRIYTKSGGQRERENIGSLLIYWMCVSYSTKVVTKLGNLFAFFP